MIVSAALFAAVLAPVPMSSPAGAPGQTRAPAVAYAADTIAHLKGHTAPARPVVAVKAGPAAACHPDPAKGRVCRHHAAQADQARQAERAERGAGQPDLAVAAREPAR